MVRIRQAIVVEGKYDKNTLAQIVDAPIFQTDGFGIRNNKNLQQLLRRVARERGLIVLTDSDGGGLVIRNFFKSIIPGECLNHAYIPDVFGKEPRKTSAGKEGKLGVEGMTPEVLLDCLKRSGASIEGESSGICGEITKQDFVQWGLSGGANSSLKRKELLQKLQFPANMSANSMLQAINLLYTRSEFLQILGEKYD